MRIVKAAVIGYGAEPTTAVGLLGLAKAREVGAVGVVLVLEDYHFGKFNNQPVDNIHREANSVRRREALGAGRNVRSDCCQ